MQRVSHANVAIGKQIVGEIAGGYVLFIGIGKTDVPETVEKALSKIKNLRAFSDDAKKINRSISDIQGEVLIVSQFTLYADCKKGNRPSFSEAALPDYAEKLYNYFVERAKNHFENVQTGIFGAEMHVSLCNDGPFTLLLDF